MGSTPIGISGSRAAVVLGMSPWSTPFNVWQDIMEAREPGFNAAHKYDYEPFEGNAATRFGLAFEDAIIELAEDKRGPIINRELLYGKRLESPGLCYGYEAVEDVNCEITCHIDGMYHGTNILHEGKTTVAHGYSDKWGEPGTDRIPIENQIQVQHQMLCTGAEECIVSVLVFPKRPSEWEEEGWIATPQKLYIPGGEGNYPKYSIDPYKWAITLNQMGYFHQYTIKADPDLHALMLDKYKAWWERYVLTETPPEAETYDDIRAMITAPVGTIIVDPDTARWFKEIKDIGSEIGATSNLAKRRDQLKRLILNRAYIREHELCPHDRQLDYKSCRGQCNLEKCSVGQGKPVLDDESSNKWIFRDDSGKKLGSYGRNAKGSMIFR